MNGDVNCNLILFILYLICANYVLNFNKILYINVKKEEKNY